MSWIILAAVFGAVMVLVSKLTRKRGEDTTTAGAAAASPPAIGDTHSGGDGDADGDGDGGE